MSSDHQLIKVLNNRSAIALRLIVLIAFYLLQTLIALACEPTGNSSVRNEACDTVRNNDSFDIL